MAENKFDPEQQVRWWIEGKGVAYGIYTTQQKELILAELVKRFDEAEDPRILVKISEFEHHLRT